jgi:hypothetical protein
VLIGGAAALAVAALPCIATGAVPQPKVRFSLPSPTGPYPTGVVELHLVQAGRSDPWVPADTRELMVSVWYPALPGGQPAPYVPSALAAYYDGMPPIGMPAGRIDWSAPRTHSGLCAPVLPSPQRRPTILYSPGGENSRIFGTIMVEELASRGYIVVTVDHTHETPVAFPHGRIEANEIPANPPDLNAAKELFMFTREEDVRFVLDQLAAVADGGNPDAEHRRLPDGLGRALDLSAIGMFGHSAGGVTTSRVVRDDGRVAAGINWDGFFEFGDNHPELGEQRSFLLMGARSAPGYPPLPGKPRDHLTDPLWSTFWDHSTGWKRDLCIPDGGHYTYTDAQWFLPQVASSLGIDPSSMIGTVDPSRIIAAERRYVGAFFDLQLRGRPQPILDGPSPEYPDVHFIP